MTGSSEVAGCRHKVRIVLNCILDDEAMMTSTMIVGLSVSSHERI